MKKYIKTNILDRSSRIGVTEIGVLSQMETYRYTSLGPSWSATNIAINLVDYSEFSKSEEIRLEENRIERAQMKEFRESRKNLKKYQKH